MENLKKFSEKFDKKLVPDFIDFISLAFNKHNNIKEIISIIDKMERNSLEFKNLRNYHIEGMKDKNYKKIFSEIVNKLNEE